MQIFEVDGVQVPAFCYGTAWKEDRSASLTYEAIKAGFRGVDTANQRKHYHEQGVGEGIRQAMQEGLVSRTDLFLQTKFTFLNGQDHRLPYDPKASFTAQVEQSFASSLDHLGTDYLDSYILHGPSTGSGLTDDDWEVWRAIEAHQLEKKTKFIGISNVNLTQLEQLWTDSKVKPKFVQNRCYATMGWDKNVRAFCEEHGIIYQGFSLLTANRDLLKFDAFKQVVEHYGRPPAQIIFRFALQCGMLPLTGTTDPAHMQDDLGMFDFEMSPEHVETIERIYE
jgi:diketogulonate reductase-like aldo/keto reductase